MTDGSTTQAATHVGVAEQGKLHALQGEHDVALLYYRRAMQGAVASGAPEVFFRHYLECSVESLELSGAYDEVLDYCDRVEAHYATVTPADEDQAAFVTGDLVATSQRRALVLAKAGRTPEALVALDASAQRAAAIGVDLPLVALVGGWLRRGLHVDPERILVEQQRLCYFAVTPDSVDRERAVRLPAEMLSIGRGD